MFYKDTILKGGLEERDADILQRAIWAFPEVERMVLYGSRARGDYFHNSDVDLAIYGPKITFFLTGKFHSVVTDGLNIFRPVDVVAPALMPNSPLVKEIEKEGVVIFDKNEK